MFENLRADIQRRILAYHKGLPRWKVVLLFLDNDMRAVATFRFTQCLNEIGLIPLGILFTYLNALFNGVRFGLKPKIGKGLVIKHGIACQIGNATIGENAEIHSQVVIGSSAKNPDKFPLIGNNVFISVGAKILGDIRIGNNVKIGPNAVVMEDIPDNATVVGNPGRVVRK